MNGIQKVRGSIPLTSKKSPHVLDSPLLPILVVPVSRRVKWSLFLPLLPFPFCLPAIILSAQLIQQLVFSAILIWAIGFSLSELLRHSLTFNQDQLILHHKNKKKHSAIMYEDMLGVYLSHNIIKIETSDRQLHASLPFSMLYWGRMKKIFEQNHIPISIDQ